MDLLFKQVVRSESKSCWNTASWSDRRGMMFDRMPISKPVVCASNGVLPLASGVPTAGTVPYTPRTSFEWNPLP